MNFRRRKGLGRSGPEGEEGDDAGPDAGAPEDASRRADRAIRRWLAVLTLLLVGAGGGYLVAAELLFPAASPADAEALVDVPDLRGGSLEEARSSVGEAGLSLRVAARLPVADADAGRVLAQRPAGGQMAASGDTVEVTVASGRNRVRVPALRALRADRARRVLGRMGFEVDTAREAASVPGGEVVRTEPPAGSAATAGSTVRVVLSEGPPVSGVPELVGRHIDDVRPLLADSGFAMGAVSYDTTAFAAPGRVIGQSPPAGFALREGERVTVRVAGPAPVTPAEAAPGAAAADTAFADTAAADTTGGS